MPQPQKPPDLDQYGRPITTGQAGAKPPDLDEYGLPMYSEEETPIQKAWKFATSPITTKPTEIAQSISQRMTDPNAALFGLTPTGQGGFRDYLAGTAARLRGFEAGALEGIGNLASELSSPLNLAVAALTGGSSLAGKAGLGQVARLAAYGARGASIPFALHGAAGALSPESTLAERGTGLAELAGGLAGMKYPIPGKRTLITSPADIDAALRSGKINAKQATVLIEKYHADKAAFDRAALAVPGEQPAVTPGAVAPATPVPAKIVAKAKKAVAKKVEPVVEQPPVEVPVEPTPQMGLPFEETVPRQMELPVPTETEVLTPPIQRAINPAVAESIRTGEVPPITGEPVAPKLTTPDEIVAAKNEGRISPADAVKRMEEFYAAEVAKTPKPVAAEVKPTEVKPTEVAPVEAAPAVAEPVAAAPTKPAYEVIPLSGVKRLKALGYDEATIDAMSVDEALTIIKGKVKAPAKTEAPTAVPKTALEIARESRAAAEVPIEPRPSAGPPTTEMPPPAVGRPGITPPPVEPLKQLPTDPRVAAVIKAIPKETGNAELDSMVKSLRALRRRKGIDEFNDQEIAAYNTLMENIKNHPNLPEGLRDRWNAIEAGAPANKVIEMPAHAGKGESLIIPKENATSDIITNARKEGYVFDGLDDRGNYKFRRSEEPSALTRLATEEKGELIVQGKRPEIGVPVEVRPDGSVAIKGNQATPENVKKLFEEGFRFSMEDTKGNLLFRKIAEATERAPVLESEVGLTRPTRGQIKREGQLGAIQDAQKSNAVMEAFNFPRGVLASWDFSAPLRQGLPLIHRAEFWKALGPMFKSWASEEGFQASQNAIARRALFKKRINAAGEELPSFADDAGLKLGDLLNQREDVLMSTWAEKVPLVRHSQRAYTAFLNNLRADVFEAMIRDSNVLGANVKTNLPLARAIADFVNTATGRGRLAVNIPSRLQKAFGGKTELSLESSANLLNTGLFAPRLIASRLKLLNPAYYIMAPAPVRREALKSLFALSATGNIVLQLAKMAGAEVSTDPNSADFGKAKIGKVRLDPWGGFQQYIVAANRLLRPGFAKIPGFEGGAQTGIVPVDLATNFLGTGGWKVTSTSPENYGREYDLLNPKGPYAPTPLTIAGRFARGKLNPVLGFAVSLLAGGKEMSGQKMNLTTPNPMENAIAQRFVPILMQDVYQIAQENPELLPLAIPASLGMGIQAYSQVK